MVADIPSGHDHQLQRTGPVCWQRVPYRSGMLAEPQAQRWLQQALGLSAAQTAIRRDAHGRPRLSAAGWDASWSHSGDGLLLAAAQGVQLGVDLEWLRPRPRALQLARRFFSATEADWLADLPGAAIEPAFVRIWCAKEAVLKAHGRGIAFGLHRLRFALDADGRLQLVACDPALGDPRHWHVHEIRLGPEERAVLAWRRREHVTGAPSIMGG